MKTLDICGAIALLIIVMYGPHLIPLLAWVQP